MRGQNIVIRTINAFRCHVVRLDPGAVLSVSRCLFRITRLHGIERIEIFSTRALLCRPRIFVFDTTH